ncbi:Site-specific recombinase XerD [Enhydrobacter aerosaccus]|uniref:Site-specific recombinase XerD n=1 Tax=Enhydrobacter aerosaccus TaxID=225324 RepID=A0A1T4T6X3_9HYPH|nr:site-specific integrase [Enhydrobacter aerosaccus]SKA36222.1 Site-specific recombinase XerD [Enhydrobacter aerosaccus]
MSKLKLTKMVVDAAQPQQRDYELRDTVIPGFLLKVTPAGRKVFMVAYVANNGQRRKPAIGRFGEITVEQARNIAQDWLADVRKGKDPSVEKGSARHAPCIKELFERFVSEYSECRNRPSTVKANRSNGKLYIVPNLGQMKASDVTRADISSLMHKMSKHPTNANRVFSTLHKMFNMAEVWGFRPDGSNPCRHVPKFPEHGKTRLINDAELKRLYAYLDKADVEGLEHPVILLAVRLQFELAARMSEILKLEWAWIDLINRRICWPESKTGGMSKPISANAVRLLETAPRLEASPYVCPAIFDPNKPMPKHTYYKGWSRILERSSVPHVGTHGIRHRSATDIANSGIPVKVGMALTAHKTVTMFMRYVHTEDDAVRAAADAVALRRLTLLRQTTVADPPAFAPTKDAMVPLSPPQLGNGQKISGCEPPVLEANHSPTLASTYRPFRHRKGANRAIPPGTKRASSETAADDPDSEGHIAKHSHSAEQSVMTPPV